MLIPIIFILILDLYAYQAIRTVLHGSSALTYVTIAYWAVSIFIYISGLTIMRHGFDLTTTYTSRLILGAFVCFFVAKLFVSVFVLLDDITRIIRFGVNFINPSTINATKENGITRLMFLNKAGLYAGGTMLGLFVWGMIRTAYNYKIRRVTVSLPQLPPSFKGLKIAQISDMHLGSFISTEPIKRAMKMVNDLEPDIIFFTGDLVNSRAKEALPFKATLSSLKAKYGVYSILGNHDYYGSEEDRKQIIQFHKECDWNILLNEHAVIEKDNTKIGILGVENWGKSHYFPKHGDVSKAEMGCEPVDIKLLLSHDPSHWDAIVCQQHKNVDITFSGHTHGFQMGIEIPQLNIKFSPSQFSYKQWAGIYKKDKQYLYVNRGLGFLGFHGRVGIPPEITFMEIKSLVV